MEGCICLSLLLLRSVRGRIMMLLEMSIVECRCMGDVGMWSGLVDSGMSDVRPGPALRLLSIGVVLSAV